MQTVCLCPGSSPFPRPWPMIFLSSWRSILGLDSKCTEAWCPAPPSLAPLCPGGGREGILVSKSPPAVPAGGDPAPGPGESHLQAILQELEVRGRLAVHTPRLLALPPAAWSVPRCPREMFNKGDQCFPRSPPALLPGLTLPAPPAHLGSFPCWGAWGPGDNLSPPRGQRWLCRIKAEGPGVPVGLAGTAVNPIGRWHRARLRITCSQRLQIGLTFPTGRRLWQPAGAVSPSEPAFPQLP